LQIPPDIEGAVAEFGCYKGLCTASLSLACDLIRRKLVVYDSFAGLPDGESVVDHIDGKGQVEYHKGDYCGTLDEVRANVQRFGRLSVCEFIAGYFEETLPHRSSLEKYGLVFEDADLPTSVRTVLRETWPRLQSGCRFFCHEAQDLQVVEIFFDREWWEQNLGFTVPGFVGSGCGINSSLATSYLGYAVKR
jgi:O-methyltransferase